MKQVLTFLSFALLCLSCDNTTSSNEKKSIKEEQTQPKNNSLTNAGYIGKVKMTTTKSYDGVINTNDTWMPADTGNYNLLTICYNTDGNMTIATSETIKDNKVTFTGTYHFDLDNNTLKGGKLILDDSSSILTIEVDHISNRQYKKSILSESGTIIYQDIILLDSVYREKQFKNIKYKEGEKTITTIKDIVRYNKNGYPLKVNITYKSAEGYTGNGELTHKIIDSDNMGNPTKVFIMSEGAGTSGTALLLSTYDYYE